MKRVFTLLITIILLTTLTPAAYGEVVTDTWYDIEKTTPYFEGYTVQSDNYKEYQLEYLKNDQTYVNYGYINAVEESPSFEYSINHLQFSYLFDCGFFIASDNMDSEGYHYNSLSPGYKFKLSNDDYFAISLRYVTNDNTYDNSENEIEHYAIRYVSYPENMKILSSLFFPTEGDIFGYFSLNYQVAEQLVVGGSILKASSFTSKCSFYIGSTWTPARFIIDNTFQEYEDEFNYFVSGMYKFNSQFRAGLGYDDVTEQFCVKAKINHENSSLKFFYYPENEDKNILERFELAYFMDL